MLTSHFADQLAVLHDNYRDALAVKVKDIDPRIQNSHIACLKIISTQPGCTPIDVSKAIYRGKSQVTRTLKSLFKQGLIIKKTNPNDGRSALLFLTPYGEEIGKILLGACHSVAEDMREGLTDQEVLTFLNVVDQMLNNLKVK